MTRRKFRSDPNGNGWIEVTDGYEAPVSKASDQVLWNDRAYQDMGDPRFSSRKQHREYMRQNGLVTYDDNVEGFKKAEAKRIQDKQGVDSRRREQIDRAIHMINNRKG